MCTDLLLACFICPAIVNMEQYGIISNAPINEVARFNLMQVGHLLQQMALTGFEEVDARNKSNLSKFDKSCVAAFLDVVIGGRVVETSPLSSVNLLEVLSRTVVYLTYSQLFRLLLFLHSISSSDQLREEDRMALENLLATVSQAKPGKSSNHNNTPYITPQLSSATTPAWTGPQLTPGMMLENEVLNMQLVDGGKADVRVDDPKLLGKPDKTLCSDNLEGISEAEEENPCSIGPSNRSSSVSSLDLEGESVSELDLLRLLAHEQVTTQDNLDDKLRKFKIRDMLGLTEDRDISENVSETWSMDVLGSDFDPNIDEDRLQEIAGAAAENMLGSLRCLPGSGSLFLDPCTGSTISETTSEVWSVEVFSSHSEAPDLKQEERLQKLESCSGLGSTSDGMEIMGQELAPILRQQRIFWTSTGMPSRGQNEDKPLVGKNLLSHIGMQKKLQTALCSVDSVAFQMVSHSTRNGLPDHNDPEDNEIVCFLKVQLAEAINLQDKNLMAQLQDTMRCVSCFDNRTCSKIPASIAEDYRKRASYIAYI
ncbi:GTPase-activating and VPS9 domain-containing 1 isoform X5 [Pelobates cultripes]|uniref:GTPase-activating and VPS9 domain-containing 1 isoform X5 n=1 Tax=Pelobates cultripes TaxID=61616 RepID=A0AAD1RPC8_PELCU|nr:GTPase-activating and VPS9 domain-containing 1 isoform X5 [Pelobates cultripes]